MGERNKSVPAPKDSRSESVRRGIGRYLLFSSPLWMGWFFLWRWGWIRNSYTAAALAILFQLGISIMAFAKEVTEEIKRRLIPRIADSTISGVGVLIGEASFRRDYDECLLRRYDLFNV